VSWSLSMKKIIITPKMVWPIWFRGIVLTELDVKDLLDILYNIIRLW
jgi:hypothetical protein